MSIVNQPTPTTQPITIAVALTPAQAYAVHIQLHDRFPELAIMRSARRVQILNVSGRFRVSAIAGGQLPAGLTPTVLATIIATAIADHPADNGAYGQARNAYQVAHSRNGRRS